VSEHALARDQPAEAIQPALPLERIEQQLQGLEEGAIAEILDPARALPRFGENRVDVEARSLTAHRVPSGRLAADPVDQAIERVGYQVVEKPARSRVSRAPPWEISPGGCM
jgi:hypothetical protein